MPTKQHCLVAKIAHQGSHTKEEVRLQLQTSIRRATVIIAPEASMPDFLGQPRARPAPEDIIPQVVLPAVQYVQKGTLQMQTL